MSCVETPQQNGVVERKRQHILNITRALIFQSNLPILFWNFATSHVFLLNRLPSKVLHNKSPYDILYNSSPDLTFIKVFGCEAFASTLAHNRTKLDPQARQYVYLGHKPGIKGSLLYDLHTREVFFYPEVFLSMKIILFLSILSIIQKVKILSCHMIYLSLPPLHHYKTNKHHILFHKKIIPLPLHHYKTNKHRILSHNKIIPLPLSQPKGVVPPKPGQFCKLRKSLYDLRQSSRQCYEKLSTVLIALGYTQSQTDFLYLLNNLLLVHSQSSLSMLMI